MLFRMGISIFGRGKMGSFSGQTWNNCGVIALLVVLGVLFLMRYGREMDLMTFGEEQALSACRQLVKNGVGAVCLTLGEKGALLVNSEGAWYSASMQVPVKSLQGAGDSLVAGLCMAMMENASPADMLRTGVTCALGSLIREGTLLCTREDFDRLYPQVPVVEYAP